jgi:hypothetical protein
MAACMAELGGAWTTSGIWKLSGDPRRFGEIFRDIPGISQDADDTAAPTRGEGRYPARAQHGSRPAGADWRPGLFLPGRCNGCLRFTGIGARELAKIAPGAQFQHKNPL